MIRELDKKLISNIEPDFIYNRFDLFCDNYIVLMAEYGDEKHIIETRISDFYAELGIWKMHISDALIKEISSYLFAKHPTIEYVKFFFCKTEGNYKRIKHFYLNLPDSIESLLQRTIPKSRRRLTNKRHQAEKSIGSISYFEYNLGNCPKEVIEKYNSWKNESHHIGTIDDIDEFFNKYHISNIYAIHFGKHVAAVLFMCEQCSIAYLENLSYNTQYAKYSPGLQVYEYALTRLIEKKIKTIYLGGGDYDYKRKYKSVEEELCDGIIFRNLYYKAKYELITYYNKHLYWKIKKIKKIL
jgi:hypothetical protein